MGERVFRTLQPLISSNFRLNEADIVLLTPMRVRICVATVGVGLSPSSNRQMRVKGSAAANFEWYDGMEMVEINNSKTFSAFS